MLKFTDTKIVFSEVPNEITLAINISGCPIRCPECHSKYLWKNIGESLNRDSLCNLINSNKGIITCVAFMGGDADLKYLYTLFHTVKIFFPKLKVAWYSGGTYYIREPDLKYLDYVKMGPYDSTLGPLNKKSTNQRFYKIIHNKKMIRIEDITHEFWEDD